MVTTPDDEEEEGRLAEIAEWLGSVVSTAVTGKPTGNVRVTLLYVTVGLALVGAVATPVAVLVGTVALVLLALGEMR
jgi:hypothetical protein